jgi:hypothetical protein
LGEWCDIDHDSSALETLDPILERVNHSGAWIVSDIVGGYRVARTYYGYTRAQAVALFRREVLANV